MRKERPVKQVIVMRTDTDPPMRRGKMIAQAGHVVLKFLLRRIREVNEGVRCVEQHTAYGDFNLWGLLDILPHQREWLEGAETKICCRADSLEELLEIQQRAVEAGLEVHLITDSGKTEFKEPTVTCLAIGPDYADRIDPVTSHLKLL